MSNNSFLPEKIVVTRNSGSGYISEVFSFETWQNINGFIAAMIFFMFLYIAPWISGIILILYCLEIGELVIPTTSNIIGILYSVYLIIDIKKEWLLSIFLNFFYQKPDHEMIIHFNISTIVTHTILLIFGEELFKKFNHNRFLLFLFISCLTFTLYFFIKNVF
jgi:hypothetical protein